VNKEKGLNALKGQLMNRKDLKSNVSQDYQGPPLKNSFFSPLSGRKEDNSLVDYNFD